MDKHQDLFVRIAQALPAMGQWSSEAKVSRKVVNRLVQIINTQVDDPRQTGKLEYPLYEIIVLAFFAILGGADTFSAVAACCAYKQRFFRKFLPLKHGIPSHDTFNRVFSLIDMDQLEKALVFFVSQSFQKLRKALKIPEPTLKQLCVDGKVARGSGRHAGTNQEIKDIQTLHVYSTEDGICLYSRQIGEKTNEIPTAQAILATMDLKGTIVSFDAMNTQKETLEIIVARKGWYIGGLKGNHKTMLQECAFCFDGDYLQKVKNDAGLSCRYLEKAHNQIEIMEFTLVRIDSAPGSYFAAWPGLKSIIRYDKQTEDLVSGKKTSEIRYYLSNLATKVSEVAMAIRQHWQVESFHWLLDVVFNDDANMTVNKRASGNMTLMKKMVLSLYRMMRPMEQVKYISDIKRLFYWGYDEGIKRLLAHCDAKAIATAMEDYKKK
jgi:predicted transposase YbfD/YdcC